MSEQEVKSGAGVLLICPVVCQLSVDVSCCLIVCQLLRGGEWDATCCLQTCALVDPERQFLSL